MGYYRELAENNPAYLFYVAIALNNIALLQRNMGKLADAEKTDKEYSKLLQQMAEKSHARSDKDVKKPKKLLKKIRSMKK